MKRLSYALALCLLPSLLYAQQEGLHKSANFTYKYDVGSLTIYYCKMSGQSGDPFSPAIKGAGTVETSGSSTTVTTVGSSGAFAAVDVGDLFSVRLQNGTVENRVIRTNADDDTITVDTSINLTGGFVWSYKKLACGTTDDDGWIGVSGYNTVQIGVQYDAGDIDALVATWECRSGAIGAAPVRVYPGTASDCGDGTLNGKVCEFSSVGDRLVYKIQDNAFSECRLGIAYKTTDSGTAEEITGTIDVGR